MKACKVPIRVKLMYGCGDIFAGGAFLVVSLLFLNFLTDVAGLNPALAGSVFLLGKLWDAVSDPLMGMISDRTKSPFGRRRVYFLAGIFPIFFSFCNVVV
ncbi:MAG: MFS transporter [Spirochaetia bacterium]